MSTGEPGRDAYRGFDYQIHATVWVLLDHFFRRAVEVVARVEPLSGQDVELAQPDATKAGDDRAVRIDLGDAEPWFVQIKTRRSGSWPKGLFEAIIKGDAKKRKGAKAPRFPSPAELLTKRPEARFLFVTDGMLSRDLEWLASDDDSWTASRRGTVRTLPPTVSTFKERIAVLHQRAFRHIARDAQDILCDELGVPPRAAPECFLGLVERVREALLDERCGTIDADQIRAIARKYRPALGDGPDGFVAPSCWDAVKKELERDHAIVLVGEAGTGKSRVAAELVRLHGKQKPSFEPARFTLRDDPKSFVTFWAPSTRSRRIAWVDDPFGKEVLAGINDRAAWAQALEGATPSPDRVLVVTSRLTFMREVEELLPKLKLRRFDFDEPFDTATRKALLAAKVAAERELTEEERAALLSRAERVVNRLRRAISIDVLPAKYREHRSVSSDRERLEQAIEAAEAAGLGKDFAAFFENQRDPIRRGAYVAGWLLELDRPVREIEVLAEHMSGDLLSAGFEVNAQRALELMRERRWLRKRPEARDEALHSTHLSACRAFSSDDRPTSIAVARAVLDTRWKAHDRDTAALLARILSDQPHLDVGPVVEPRRVMARNAVAARPAPKAFSRALRLLATAGRADEPLDLVAMALDARVAPGEERWFVRGFHEWERPRWSDETYDAVRKTKDVQALAHSFIEERVARLPVTFVSERELVDFLYDIADVGPAFLELEPRLEEIGYEAEAAAYGIARATTDYDRLVRRAIAIVDSLGSELDQPFDEDSEVEGEFLAEQYQGQIAPAKRLAEAVVRVAPPEFLLGRTEPLLFERYGELVARLPSDDPRTHADYVRAVIARCPPEALARVIGGLAERDGLLDLALEGLARLPVSEWGSVTFDLFERGRVNRGEIVVRWLGEGFLPSTNSRDRMRALAELREGIPPDALGALLARLSDVERDAYVALTTGSAAAGTSRGALGLLYEVARMGEPGASEPLPILAAAGIDVREEIHRFARSRYVGAASAALTAARHLPESERGELALAGLAHARASVRKHAALLAAGIAAERVRLKLAEMASGDSTPSARIAAVRAIATVPDEFALRVIERALADRTDTSDAARRGHMSPEDEEEGAEFGVAATAREVLAPLERWPAALQDRARGLAAAHDAGATASE